MRVLILGGDGMLGHRLLQDMGDDKIVAVTLRRELDAYAPFGLYRAENAFTGIDLRQPLSLLDVLGTLKPHVVVNAVGIVKQREASSDVLHSLEVNALLPHHLAAICRAAGARLIHISTDCVFGGSRGLYRETDAADALDVYGRTKLLGEVSQPGCLTLRTSIIGLELHRRRSLVEWYLAQTGTIRGFTRAIFSGVTTRELCRVIRLLIEQHPDLSGIYHVASEPMSKYQLLVELTKALGRQDIDVLPEPDFVCDRSLDGSLFRSRTRYVAPSWTAMLDELARDIHERSMRSREMKAQ